MGCGQSGPAPAAGHPGRPSDASRTTARPFTPQDIAFSPDGRFLASVTGTDHVTVWNVTDPARAARIATLTGSRDLVQTLAFSPRGNLLVGVTYYGTVLVFSLADPARPALTTTISGIMAHALYPDGLLQHPTPRPAPLCSPANYAVAFTPDGRTLTVVVARQEGNVTVRVHHRHTRHGVHVERDQLRRTQRPQHRHPRRQRQPARPGPRRPHRGGQPARQPRLARLAAALTRPRVYSSASWELAAITASTRSSSVSALASSLAGRWPCTWPRAAPSTSPTSWLPPHCRGRPYTSA